MERSSVLILKYLRGEISVGEQLELDAWKAESEFNRQVFRELSDTEKLSIWMKENEKFSEDVAWAGISGKIGHGLYHKPGRSWWRYAAVAALVVLLAGGAYMWIGNKPAAEVAQRKTQPDIAPGRDNAILTLADGSVIELDSAANGELSRQGGATVVKLNNGQLSYTTRNQGRTIPGELLYNTIRTPRGSKYQIVLPDGSQVWLNAASSLRFPAVFSGAARSVELEGEGYFEVKENAVMPFIVNASGVNVEVLGTSFNINSYTDEDCMRTTLIDGKVKVAEGKAYTFLTTGQQAQIRTNEVPGLQNGRDRIDVRKVNLEEVTAWKNGYFSFDKADVSTVMRQLSRWYDVEVVNNGAVPARRFTGGMQRSLPLSKVLDILKDNDVKLEINGRKITLL